MSQREDPPDSEQSPTPGTTTTTTPEDAEASDTDEGSDAYDEITVADWIWDLRANPEQLETAAQQLRTLASAALTGRETVINAARQIQSEEAWTGDAAEAYQDHRRSLTAWLRELAESVNSGAWSLEYLAGELRSAASVLYLLRASLNDIESEDEDGETIFLPVDEDEAQRVNAAVMQAETIRAGVEENLVSAEGKFRRRLDEIREISDRWETRRSTEAILAEYRVESSGEMVEYTRLHDLVEDLPGNFELPAEVPLVSQAEAEILDELGYTELFQMSQIESQATSTASERYPDILNAPHDGSHRNAFQHAYWNALMTIHFDQDFAREYGTAHEATPTNPASTEAMDLYNNEMGRRIAADNPNATPEELADLIEEAIRNGDLMVTDHTGQLVYSDQIPVGTTGMGTGEPGGGPPPPDAEGRSPADPYEDDVYEGTGG